MIPQSDTLLRSSEHRRGNRAGLVPGDRLLPADLVRPTQAIRAHFVTDNRIGAIEPPSRSSSYLGQEHSGALNSSVHISSPGPGQIVHASVSFIGRTPSISVQAARIQNSMNTLRSLPPTPTQAPALQMGQLGSPTAQASAYSPSPPAYAGEFSIHQIPRQRCNHMANLPLAAVAEFDPMVSSEMRGGEYLGPPASGHPV